VNYLKRKVKDRDAALQMANAQAKAMTMAFEEMKKEVRILKMENESLKVSKGRQAGGRGFGYAFS